MDAGWKPPNQIDEHSVRHAAPTWESLLDRHVREAIEEGTFNDEPDELARLDALHRG